MSDTIETAAETADAASDAGPLLHTSIYEELRRRLITGIIAPGDGLSTRTLAGELGVSQMPVRDALSRLSAEGALLIRSKRRIEVPPMTAARFDDLLKCRLTLEPEAAVTAMPHINAAGLERLRRIDSDLDRAIAADDMQGYTELNAAFHFALYRSGGRDILNRLIETLWLQFGPYMRSVYTQHPERIFADQHRNALAAIAAGNSDALRQAIATDINDGMSLIGRNGLA